LQLTRAQIDEISGLQEGYSSKILRKSRLKKLGSISMPNLFGTLGVKLFLVEDPEATAKTLSRRTPRREAYVQSRDAYRATV
jgi:hypothetical protein